MPVELRKRKAPAPPPEPPAKKPSKASKVVSKVKEAVKGKPEAKLKANGAAAAKASSPAKKPEVGGIIDLATFGGEVTTNDGKTTTLAQLVEGSGSGVVLFTYPKASTPGCTTQACLFRDSYEPLTAAGLAIYGLSRDSPKSNTTFKEKQKLPYPLLCDPSASLIGAIGLKKAPSGTQRGVFVVDKKGKVLLAEPGGPAGTVDAVKKLVESGSVNGGTAEKEEGKDEGEPEEKAQEEAQEEAGEKAGEKAGDKIEETAEEKTNGAAAEAAKAEETAEKKDE